MTYVPSLADMQYLAMTDPVMMPLAGNVRTVSQSSAFLNGEDISQQVEALYSGQGGYLDRGGTPLTESPVKSVTMEGDGIIDPQQSWACPDCAPNSPCCMEKLELGCEHGDKRITIPDESKPDQINKLALVADKGDSPSHHDTLKGKLTFTSNANCKQSPAAPQLHLCGEIIDKQVAAEFEEKLTFGSSNGALDTLTDLGRFGKVTYDYIFGDIEDSAHKIDLSVISCGGITDFNTEVFLFPKVSWEAANLKLDLTTKFYTNGVFEFTPKFEGSLAGSYAGSAFEIKGEVDLGAREDHILHQGAEDNMGPVPVPFFDSLISTLSSISPGSPTNTTADNTTLSYIGIRHVGNLGGSKFALAEHSTLPSEVGIDAEITFGFAPIFGLDIHLDIIDALANVATPAMARAIREARAAMAKGIGDRTSVGEASLHAAVYLKVNGDFGNGGLTVTRSAGDESWNAQGNMGGEIGATVGAEIKGKARVYKIRGTLSAQGTATTKLKLDVETIPQADQTGDKKDKKLKAKLEWDGVVLQYRGEAKGEFAGISASARDSGSMTIFEKEVLGEWAI